MATVTVKYNDGSSFEIDVPSDSVFDVLGLLNWDEDKYPTKWFHADGTEF